MRLLFATAILLVLHCLGIKGEVAFQAPPERSLAAAARLESDIRVIVRYTNAVVGRRHTTQTHAKKLSKRDGVTHVKPLLNVGMAIVSCSSQKALENLVGALAQDSLVELAVPDTLVWAYDFNETDDGNSTNEIELPVNPITSTTVTTTLSYRLPNDPEFYRLWGLPDIDAPEAWASFTGNSSHIVVAVIDTGIDYNHVDLHEQMWSNPGEIPNNGIDDDDNGYVDDIHGVNFVENNGDPFDDNIHGTHCAGTIAAVGNNGVGVAGVAWRGVKLMALKFLDGRGSGRTSDAISAVDYAVAHGARITSNSWGGGGSSSAMRVAIERAEAAGLLFIAAAGNSASNNDMYPHFPSNYQVDSIVSVASTQTDGSLSSFSCYGPETVHVAAPGSDILSTAPGNKYKSLSGTSMATPHVSGLAALVWMYRPQLTPLQLKQILLSTAVKSEQLEGRISTGAKINARLALRAAGLFHIPQPPVHPPRAIAFHDVDGSKGSVSGVVTLTAAEDESDVDYYKIYFVSAAGFPLSVLGEIQASGAPTLTLLINESLAMPRYATGFIAVAGNASGEMTPWHEGLGPIVDVEDFIMPVLDARAVSWSGDSDCRPGHLTGAFHITRADDEDTISSYNIYWLNQSSDGARGPLLGSIPGIGFQKPTCKGSCSLVEQTELPGGTVRYSRAAYTNNENVVISFSGPARVDVKKLDIENGYDSLVIGNVPLTGSMSNVELHLPDGISSITWKSDSSVTSAGWSLEISQSNTTADFLVEDEMALGESVEVVAAFGVSEKTNGIAVSVKDCSEQSTQTHLRGGMRGAVAGGALAALSPSASVSSALTVDTVSPKDDNTNSPKEFKASADFGHVSESKGSVLASVTIEGWSPDVGHSNKAWQAVSNAVLIALEEKATSLQVTVLRAEPQANSLIKFSFEVVPLVNNLDVLDGLEARLILMGMDGAKAAQRFNQALKSESVATTLNLRCIFGPAWQSFSTLRSKP
jgi:hypothetical protein